MGGLDQRGRDQATSSDELLARLQERQELFERLSEIQRSISHRAPLQEVLDAITEGASKIFGDEIVGLRLLDPEDPAYLVLVSAHGVSPEQLEMLRRGPVGEGAGGRAITENRLVIMHSYDQDPSAIPAFRADKLQAAMAVPVREAGRVAGSLVVATHKPGRTYSDQEQEALLALGEHASLALTDAKTVAAMREAQQAKDMFLAMVSHELKTPLTVIMGTLRTFQKHYRTLDDDLREQMLAAAFERGRDLQRLIDRLLEGTRAELAGVRRHMFLPDVVEEAARGFAPDRVRVAEVPRVFALVDDIAVNKIIGVFLENAIAHSPPDTQITVAASVTDDEVSICVRNVGTLGDSVDHTALFLPFQRGPEPSSPGVGLGLYIASRLATALEGKIVAENETGSVSFTLTIPAKTTAARGDEPTGSPP